MTKTSAAKRFAETYGIFDDLDGKYQLRSIYSEGVFDGVDYISRSRLTAAQNDTHKAYRAQQAAIAQHVADLKIVMALLGVEDQYDDTVENVFVTSAASYVGGRFEDVVTKTAVQKFAEDLRAAQSAVEGQAALKRLRKAIKSVTKEESK